MLIVVKIITSAIIITIVTEIAKRNTSLGGLIAAMPLTTVITLIWLYIEKRDINLLSDFTKSVLFAIIPTIMFFIPAIILFKKGWNFYIVMIISFICFSIAAFIHQKLVN